MADKVSDVTVLPDDSAFCTASFPLPEDHWIYQREPNGFSSPPPMPLRMPSGEERTLWEGRIREAAKYAIRGATMHGTEEDFDPDALVQNLLVGLFGYYTPDGLDKDDAWANPDKVPPFVKITEVP